MLLVAIQGHIEQAGAAVGRGKLVKESQGASADKMARLWNASIFKPWFKERAAAAAGVGNKGGGHGNVVHHLVLGSTVVADVGEGERS